MSWRSVACAHIAIIAASVATLSGLRTQTALVVIHGRVLDAKSTNPILNATVVVASKALATGVTVRTDDTGRFEVGDLPAGDYTIIARSIGFLAGAYGTARPIQPSSLDPLGAPPLSVTPDITRRDLVIRLWPPASVSGTITNETDEPVRDVHLQAWRWAIVGGARKLVSHGNATTDAMGRYAIAGLYPGEYLLQLDSVRVTMGADEPTQRFIADLGLAGMRLSDATGNELVGRMKMYSIGQPLIPKRADRRIRAYASWYWRSSPSATQAETIALAEGDRREGLDFHLVSEATVTISGRVTGPADAIKRLGVRLVPLSDDCQFAGNCDAAVALTGDDGRFVMAGVLSGQYRLVATRLGVSQSTTGGMAARSAEGVIGMVYYDPKTGGPLPLLPPKEPTVWANQGLGVASDDIADIELPLHDGLTISGRMLFEGGKPPSQNDMMMTVLGIEPADGRAWPGMAPMVRIAPDGTFVTDAMPGGRYFLRPGNLPKGWSLKQVRLVGLDVSNDSFDLFQDVSGVLLVLTDQTNELNGVVRRPDTTPDPSASVVVFTTNRQHWTNNGRYPRDIQAIRVTSRGAFAFKSLPEGEYFLGSMNDPPLTNWRDPVVLAQLAARASRVKVQPSGVTTQDLTSSIK